MTTISAAPRPAPFRLAVVGKGGSGKSMVAGTLARLLARRGHKVLALDSDPMPGLAVSVGVQAQDGAMLEGYAERKSSGEWRIVRGLKPATLVRRAALKGPDDVLFLQFGKVRSASMAPMMSSLQAFWAVTQQLEAERWTIVHDLPAGTRQPFSGWAGPADLLLIVAEPTQKSILSAKRLQGVTEVSDRARLALVANKLRSPGDEALVRAALPSVPFAAAVPFDPSAAAAERAGMAPIDRDPGSPAVRALASLSERLDSLAGKNQTRSLSSEGT